MKKTLLLILKFIAKLLCILYGVGFLLEGIVGIIICFTDDINPLALGIILAIFFLALGTLLLYVAIKKIHLTSKNIPEQNTTLSENNRTLKQEPIHAEIISSPVPEEQLRDMRQCYSPMQAQGDIRVLNDCISIMNSTSNLNTFFSRYELAMQTILTLEQAKQAGINVNIPTTSSYVMSLKNRADYVLQSAYKKELEEISNLKTPNGKRKRIDKFISNISEYQDEFEFSETYKNIMNDLNSYKNEL